MDAISKLKLSIYETHNAGLIDEETMTEMVSVCESSNIDDDDDRVKLGEIVDKLVEVNESKEDDEDEECEDGEECEGKKGKKDENDEEDSEVKESVTSLKLKIYESADSGSITEEQRNLLLNILQ